MFRLFTPIIALFFFVSVKPLYCQDAQSNESEVKLNLSGEILSSYIWRGQNNGHRPSIQPTAELSWKGFTAGVVGAFKLTGPGENEFDVYISKEIGPFTIELWDYWSFGNEVRAKFFDYNPSTTNHMIEAQLKYSAGEINKFNFMLSSIFFGMEGSESIYGEIEYVRSSRKNEYSVFTGYQLNGNFYADKGVFVNAGVSYSRDLTLFQKYDFALVTSFINNPARKTSYVTLGIVL